MISHLRGGSSSLSELHVFRQFFSMLTLTVVSVYLNVLAMSPGWKGFLALCALFADLALVVSYPVLTVFPLISTLSATLLLVSNRIRDRQLRPTMALVCVVISIGLAGLQPGSAPSLAGMLHEEILANTVFACAFHGTVILLTIFFSKFFFSKFVSILVVVSIISVRLIAAQISRESFSLPLFGLILLGVVNVILTRKTAAKLTRQTVSLEYLSASLGWVGALFVSLEISSLLPLCGIVCIGVLLRRISDRRDDEDSDTVIPIEHSEVDLADYQVRHRPAVHEAPVESAAKPTVLVVQEVDVGDEDELFAQLTADLGKTLDSQKSHSTRASSVA